MQIVQVQRCRYGGTEMLRCPGAEVQQRCSCRGAGTGAIAGTAGTGEEVQRHQRCRCRHFADAECRAGTDVQMLRGAKVKAQRVCTCSRQRCRCRGRGR